ncbi:hypothetical protein Y032_0002g680 [Ancylostoma ceylanicum]|uniref:Uncharacterized protein n=1 Tax=Ancylostoma ceylanicum TaxID=53326 RepID=A0A016W2L4_9BILA|nr:hypothetical protein Y032_0002g680 [Ancylostoma ceylanicum]
MQPSLCVKYLGCWQHSSKRRSSERWLPEVPFSLSTKQDRRIRSSCKLSFENGKWNLKDCGSSWHHSKLLNRSRRMLCSKLYTAK